MFGKIGAINIDSSRSFIKNKLKDRFLLLRQKCMQFYHRISKLRTYKLFKKTFRLENYYGLLSDTSSDCLCLHSGEVLIN